MLPLWSCFLPLMKADNGIFDLPKSLFTIMMQLSPTGHHLHRPGWLINRRIVHHHLHGVFGICSSFSCKGCYCCLPKSGSAKTQAPCLNMHNTGQCIGRWNQVSSFVGSLYSIILNLKSGHAKSPLMYG
jgi:hypothetical protein